MAKFIMSRREGQISAGQLVGDQVTEHDGTLPVPGQPTGRKFRLDEVRLSAPIPSPPAFRDFYAFEAHVAAARGKRGLEMLPEWYEIPVFYFSNPGVILGPDEPVLGPATSEELDYELEVAAIINQDCSDVPAERAWDHVAGFTILNDWSARDLQRKEMRVGLGPAKGKDFATSIGPWLVTLDELEDLRQGDRHNLAMVARVNGRELSRGNLSEIYWTFPQMIEHASRDTWLRCGDIIGSGTVGTGCILELGPENTGGWLKPGDVVECEVERLGILRNRIERRSPLATSES